MRESEIGPYRPPLRLYVADALAPSAIIRLGSDQAHYLQHVMRRKPGDAVALFNGRDGEWSAMIEKFSKTSAEAKVGERLRAQVAGSDLWLVFAPVKRARLDFMVQKAVELGVSAIKPVVTRYTIVERVKETRLIANAIEAAEQCGRLDVPKVAEPQPLMRLIDAWPAGRRLYFCDEAGDAQPLAAALNADAPQPAAVLIGPEGGFHPDERAALRALPAVRPVTLGPRILRADTAAIAALAIWQSLAGDWRST